MIREFVSLIRKNVCVLCIYRVFRQDREHCIYGRLCFYVAFRFFLQSSRTLAKEDITLGAARFFLQF